MYEVPNRRIDIHQFRGRLKDFMGSVDLVATKREKIDLAIDHALKTLNANPYREHESMDLIKEDYELLCWMENRISGLKYQYDLMASKRGVYLGYMHIYPPDGVPPASATGAQD